MKLIPWMVLLSLTAIGCSGSKSAQNVEQEVPQIELSDADEFIENPNEEPLAFDADAAATEPAVVVEGAETPIVTEEPVVAVEDATPIVEDTATPVISDDLIAGAENTYTVQKNETLMLIAFKLYGDYEKWKELANYNSGVLNGGTAVRPGMTLKYLAPAEEFVWNPQGLPYLIRTGDTLGGISNQVYNTAKKWKSIWNNNRPLIKDPNKIFAGFTIYYLEDGREVASEI